MVTFGEILYENCVKRERERAYIYKTRAVLGNQSKTPPIQLQLAKMRLKRHERRNRRGGWFMFAFVLVLVLEKMKRERDCD
jgi:hypothetical protein